MPSERAAAVVLSSCWRIARSRRVPFSISETDDAECRRIQSRSAPLSCTVADSAAAASSAYSSMIRVISCGRLCSEGTMIGST